MVLLEFRFKNQGKEEEEELETCSALNIFWFGVLCDLLVPTGCDFLGHRLS